MKRKKILHFNLIVLVIAVVIILSTQLIESDHPKLILIMKSNQTSFGQIFFNRGDGYIEENSVTFPVFNSKKYDIHSIEIPKSGIESIRIDPIAAAGTVYIHSIRFVYSNKSYILAGEKLKKELYPWNQLTIINTRSDSLIARATGSDPYFNLSNLPLPTRVSPGIWPGLIILFVLILILLVIWMDISVNKWISLIIKHKLVLVLFLLFAIHLLHSWNLLVHSEFWGEDGSVFFQGAFNNGWKSIFESYMGYFHTVQRILAQITMGFPMEAAPFVFNGFAFIIQFLPILLILSKRTDPVLPLFRDKLIVSLIYILLPTTFESHISLTFIQWYMAIWFIFFVLSKPAKSKRLRFFEAIYLLLFVITGPFVLFVFPVYLTLMVLKKVRFRRFVATTVSTGFVIQSISVLTSSDVFFRETTLNPFDLISLLSSRIFWNSQFGLESYKIFPNQGSIAYYCGFLFLAFLVFLIFKSRNTLLIFFLIFSFLVIAGGFYKNDIQFDKPLWHSRYFIYSVFSILLSLYMLTKYHKKKWKRAILIIPLLTSAVFAVPAEFVVNRMYDTNWERTVKIIKASKPGSEMKIPINPRGWVMTLKKK